MKRHEMWYSQEAADWNEALPIGNGRLGAMVFGGVGREHIQVNEDSVWYGGPMERNNPSTKEKLPQIRELLMQGKIHEAERLCKMAMGGTPQGMRVYQTLGDIELTFDLSEEKAQNYRRSLDLDQALASVSFDLDETHYERKIFISAPDDVCVIKCTASGKNKMNLDVLQTRHHLYDYSRKYAEDSICLGGNLGRDGLDYEMICKAYSPDGKIEVIGESIFVTNASEIILYWSAGTTFRMKELSQEIEKILIAASQKSYEDLLSAHLVDYQNFYNRVSFGLETEYTKSELPTDMRLINYQAGEKDLELEEMYFHFGRYLLISCSRPGTLPANLQGIWNDAIEAPWDSKYTININTEMNYWPAEICDLGECHLPLFDLLKRMVPNGQKTAKTMYGCRGFVAHHNTDIWADTAPQDLWIPGSFWVMGGAWLCTHIWMHYEYTKDMEFLREMFPVMREAALFFLDFCIEYKGYLCTCPSVSPENTFILPNGEFGANSIGVTMDNQILRDLFEQCLKAAELLHVSDEIIDEIEKASKRIRPTQIGSDGRIMEWCEEYAEKEPGHRHISHLYGLHPSCQITKDGTPELAKACEKTLEGRLKYGGGHTGWSRAWIMNHYAKLWNGEKAYENLRQLLMKSTLPNLFDNHPPFQIDGNFGSTAAICEMLVQSDEKRVVLLPALPKEWRTGRICGLKVRGNIKIDLSWENGELKNATVCSKFSQTRVFVYQGKSREVQLQANKKHDFMFE